MTDYQQAAIEAAEDALRADIWDGDPEDIPPTMEREAELAVDAAEPHLRRKWRRNWWKGSGLAISVPRSASIQTAHSVWPMGQRCAHCFANSSWKEPGNE